MCTHCLQPPTVPGMLSVYFTAKAYFIKKPEPTVTVYLGENRSIECVGGGKPQPRIVWRKLGAGELTHSNGLLILDNIKESDAGIYECIVIGDRNTVKTNTTVIVSTKECKWSWCVHTHVCTYTHTHARTHTHTHACTHTHTRTHARTHAHTHRQTQNMHTMHTSRMYTAQTCTACPSTTTHTVYPVVMLLLSSWVSLLSAQTNVPTETVIVIGIALVALVFYLLVAILILCACAQCCRARLRMKHKELLQMEAEVRRSSRKSQDVKDNSAILRQTPGFSSPGAIATTSFAIPASPSPSGSRRAMTVVSVDAPTVNSITTPPPSLPTTITEPVQLPNFSRRNLKVGTC